MLISMSARKSAYDHFIGKICTVFVGPTALVLSPTQFNDYFVGLVDALDDTGILTTHPLTGCKNFFPWGEVVGICEEQVLNPANPEDAKIIKELKAKPQPLAVKPASLVDIEQITQLAGLGKELLGS